ncbi:GAF domain-containing protein [Parafrankia sp. BMG5.11]|nr:GAF domain-containing protein [Parafrankia sp. BMG5.11]
MRNQNLPDPQTAVDLTNCDREPIHLLGGIQPIGFLLAFAPDWTITRASANLDAFFPAPPPQPVGMPLDQVFSSEAVHSLRNRVAMLIGADSLERIFGIDLFANGARFDLAVHVSNTEIVVEAEPTADHDSDATSIVRSMVARLQGTGTMIEYLGTSARLIRSLTGYDRVMVYRFSPDGSGEVAAEACGPDIGSFKGLHYPASDIPAQARELYKRNLLRVISDVEAAPVPIVPALDNDGNPLDLSLSILRSVSPIHIEYLKNMGVAASMSISIIVDGELWGLFACHHYSPTSPSFKRRSVCELFAQMFSLGLEVREHREVVQFERHARDLSDQLLGAVASDESLLNDPDWLSDILTSAIPADGVGVWMNGTAAMSGQTPSPEEFRQIIGHLTATANSDVVATDHLASIMPGAEHFAHKAAGMLAIPLSRTMRNYVLLFREELVRSVSWGGDPHKPVEYGPNGPRLTPRESFAEWKETVQGHSKPFTSSELRVAETLRTTLIEVVLRMADEATVQRKQANERQELLIAELNHRVRNILGVIRGLVRQSKQHDGDVSAFVETVDGRIHALARAHNQITDDHWGPAPIQALIDAEAAAFLSDRPDRITTSGGYVLLNPQAYSTMALVIHELVTNSSKYGSLSTDGIVDISWRRSPDGDLLVDWVEQNGPRVKQPSRQGFGTTIINRSVPYDLGGRASIDYPAEGVRAHFCIPSRHVSESSADHMPVIKYPRPAIGHPVPPPLHILAGHSVILVEDSLIIAYDAEDILDRLGAEAVLTAANAANALELLDRTAPTIGMLDINLGEGTSLPVADALADRGIPFFFATGYGDQAQLPDRHAHRPILQKPYTLENVAKAFDALLAMQVAGTDATS